MSLSTLEQHIMLAVLRRSPEAYGITIVDEISTRTGAAPSIGSVYAALERLEEKGYVASKQGEATAERGGKRKLFYKLTAPGQSSLQQSLRALDSLRVGVRLKEARA